MKESIIAFLLNHIWNALSLFTYSYIEYRIGINKNIPENSLWEIIKNRWSKKWTQN